MAAELGSLLSEVSFLRQRLENSVSRELYESMIAENSSLKASNSALLEQNSSLEKENAQYREMQTRLKAENTDFRTLMEFWQRHHFAPSSETMTEMMDNLAGKLPGSKIAMLADIANFIAESNRKGWETPVEENAPKKETADRKSGRKSSGSVIDRSPRTPRCLDVRAIFGPDFSGMPPGIKMIMRRGKEDTYTVELLFIERQKAFSKIFTIARCNVPGEDPMNTKYPPRLFDRIPMDPSFARFYMDMKFGYNLSEGRILEMLGKMGAA